LSTSSGILLRFGGGSVAREAKSAAAAAARAAGQASAVCHMGAHALGAAAYAVEAATLAHPDKPMVAKDELRWQFACMTASVRDALGSLPPLGENRSGPLGPGLLATGQIGKFIRDIQAGLAGIDPI
jgi:hypothetical protein